LHACDFSILKRAEDSNNQLVVTASVSSGSSNSSMSKRHREMAAVLGVMVVERLDANKKEYKIGNQLAMRAIALKMTLRALWHSIQFPS